MAFSSTMPILSYSGVLEAGEAGKWFAVKKCWASHSSSTLASGMFTKGEAFKRFSIKGGWRQTQRQHKLRSPIVAESTPDVSIADIEGTPEVVELPEDVAKAEREVEEQIKALREENAKLRERMVFAQTAPREVPPPGEGKRIFDMDPTLNNHRIHLEYRFGQYKKKRFEIDQYENGLEAFSRGYEKLGFTRSKEGITYREWAPGAKFASLIGDFNNWNPNADVMKKNEFGVWELFLPDSADGSPAIPHGSRVKIHMDTPMGWKDAIPAWIKFAVQAPGEIPYNGIYYDPPPQEKYIFQHPRPKRPRSLRIYEAHIGMSSPEPKISTYIEFRDNVLPRVKRLGYNALQLMAIQEHAYYGSFGYHVTNFFAVSSRCGTPDELKSLVDRAHELGIVVLMDCVHSHASNNVLDGLNMFDGTDAHYFHSGARGYHWMWDSRLFNYSNWEVIRFLLSNLRWWMEEYKFDGFRFDGITSMMYTHHGLQMAFTGNYEEYFGFATDVDAMVYLMLANDMLHGLYPEVITIAEDVSGMPTLCRPVHEGGVGFDYRLQMAIADKWIEFLSEMRDEEWNMGNIVHTLTNRRWAEKAVAYAESHDQALVGDKTIAFWLMDKDMYDFMALNGPSTPAIDRGIALHKMIRLITLALGGEAYLNFMGNEFGHPEWIDFPRWDFTTPSGKFIPGNGGSYQHCRRRFDLADADFLRYKGLQDFDAEMNALEDKFGFMVSEHQYVSRKDEGDKLIVFERGDLVFVFNFHWHNSYTDYRVGCLKPGKYKVVLDSDMGTFGGYNRIDHNVTYFTQEGWYDGRPHSFLVYAPSRTASVYAPTDFVDPLDVYCEDNPETDECRTYDE
eukprot:TRINITY_DN323_c0_g1_i5.p1 TRINITY_DN323_c0_g1~~TRINITY_DN323_c0_g1_i5.p1  ORF type:complete len:870 (+),score=237.80 TRINITY_DN323_c0_g1_i5:78-2612(+)